MSTTIYLDVDGVLNAVTRKSESLIKATGWDRWETRPVNQYPILWAPELIEALNRLATREDVTFKWLTTWTGDAAKILSPAIGIDGQEWPVLDGDLHAWGGPRGWWKLEAIRSDVEATDPEQIIWIDDDLSTEVPALNWMGNRTNRLAVSPFVSEGLTREHVATIAAFIGESEELEA